MERFAETNFQETVLFRPNKLLTTYSSSSSLFVPSVVLSLDYTRFPSLSFSSELSYFFTINIQKERESLWRKIDFCGIIILPLHLLFYIKIVPVLFTQFSFRPWMILRCLKKYIRHVYFKKTTVVKCFFNWPFESFPLMNF